MSDRDKFMMVVLILVTPHINLWVAAICAIICALHFYFNTEDEPTKYYVNNYQPRTEMTPEQLKYIRRAIERDYENSNWPEIDDSHLDKGVQK